MEARELFNRLFAAGIIPNRRGDTREVVWFWFSTISPHEQKNFLARGERLLKKLTDLHRRGIVELPEDVAPPQTDTPPAGTPIIPWKMLKAHFEDGSLLSTALSAPTKRGTDYNHVWGDLEPDEEGK